MNKIAIIGNYPPRQCGIATFTKDLNEGFKEISVNTAIIAINEALNRYEKNTGQLKRLSCRIYEEKHFSKEIMTKRCMEVYQKNLANSG